jgi:hypothetical protein
MLLLVLTRVQVLRQQQQVVETIIQEIEIIQVIGEKEAIEVTLLIQ